MRRIVRAGVAAALLISPVLTTVDAQAASADQSPKSGGVSVEINDGSAPVKSGGVAPMSSTKLSSGTLYFTGVNGIQVGSSYNSMLAYIKYEKTSGGQIYAEFEYEEGGVTHWDQGAFYQNAGETRSYSWGIVPLPANCSAIGKMWVSGQQTFQTPPEHPC